MTAKKEGPQPISRLIEGALRACGLHERMQERAALRHWSEIVGDGAAANVRAVDLQDGILVLEADHGAWRQEMTMLAPEIIARFNERLGEGAVTSVQWRDRPARGKKRKT